MGKLYEALEILWSPSKNEYLMPGEQLELDDEMAKLLMDKKAVKPATLKRQVKKVRRKDYDSND